MRKETDADQIDFNKKILHMSWHPFEDSIAIAATNNVSLVCSLLMLVILTKGIALRVLRSMSDLFESWCLRLLSIVQIACRFICSLASIELCLAEAVVHDTEHDRG
jgi:hypothetical protein